MTIDTTPSAQLNAVGNVVLVVVDIQGGPGEKNSGLTTMSGKQERLGRAVKLVDDFRAADVPVVFIQEVHKRSLIDIGRELDGDEGPHCIEGDPETEIYHAFAPRPEEFVIRKRRYSAFFGTELDIVLRGYKAETIILIGGMTDVCIHYTAVDAHQLDYRFRTIVDLVGGSSQELHENAFKAMKYMQRDGLVSSAAVYEWLRGAS